MIKRELKFPKGYHPKTQRQVGLYAAQLDDQLKRLKNNIKGLTTKQLEWQQRSGMNTIGMLLSHLAGVEVWWINVAPKEIKYRPDGEEIIIRTIGTATDGIPLPQTGKHPKELKGLKLDDYMKMLNKARRSIHKEMKTWQDKDLDKFYSMKWAKRQFTRNWTLYHVLEHFAGHFGQILLIKHQMRAAGVLKELKS